jgi:hypothetical protein
MAMSNRSILEKADLALSELVGGGGVLQPAQSRAFMQLLIKESVLMKLVTVVPMGAPKQQVSKIRFGSRILRPGQEATALGVDDRAKPDFSQVELDAKLFKAEVRLSDEVLEDSIERGDLRQTIMTMMAEAISRDMEDIVINGDSASSDPFLRVMDGLLKQARSHIVDAAGVRLNKDVLTDLIRTIPSEYLRDRKVMRFFTSVDADIDYRSSLAERATAAGDRFLESDAPAVASGIPLQAIPLFPENLGSARDRTAALLCHPKNIHVGIWRQIRIETAREISEGVLKVVATLRFDVKFSDELGVAQAINVQL